MHVLYAPILVTAPTYNFLLPNPFDNPTLSIRELSPSLQVQRAGMRPRSLPGSSHLLKEPTTLPSENRRENEQRHVHPSPEPRRSK